MRISDWSSDVCSSDLVAGIVPVGNEHLVAAQERRYGVAQQGSAVARHRREQQDAGSAPIRCRKPQQRAERLAHKHPSTNSTEERRGGEEWDSASRSGGVTCAEKKITT